MAKNNDKWLKLLAMVVLASFFFQSIRAQDTILTIKKNGIVDSSFLRIMDDVYNNAQKCTFVQELPCYVSVSVITNKYSEDRDITFTTKPYNESILLLHAFLWGCSDWGVTQYEDMTFLFTFSDTSLFTPIGYDTLSLHSECGIDYEIIGTRGDYPLPLCITASYTYDSFRKHAQSQCVDISNMEKIVINKQKVLFVNKNK